MQLYRILTETAGVWVKYFTTTTLLSIESTLYELSIVMKKIEEHQTLRFLSIILQNRIPATVLIAVAKIAGAMITAG